jgi:hypothetical protein
MAFWGPFGLLLITAALLLLPVAPALIELHERTDAAPLLTSRHDGRIVNFADSFHARLEPLRPQFELCRHNEELVQVSIAGMNVLLVGRDDFHFLPDELKSISAVMCAHALIPAKQVLQTDIHAQKTLELRESAAVRAALSGGDIILRRNSTAFRWLHANGNIYLLEGSSAFGRLSARHSIHLEPGCAFEHMFAPQITTTGSYDEDPADELFKPHAPPANALHVAVRQLNPHSRRVSANAGHVFVPSRPRLRVQGDFVLDPGETMNANVIATGEIRLGAGSRFLGSAKGYHDVDIEEGASVHGSIVCGGNLRLGPRSFVAGPIIAEGNARIARGSRIGSPESLTTISVNAAQIATGCTLHGTCWARAGGKIEG